MYDSVDLKLHRIRFYINELYSINCIAYNEKESKVALLRRRVRKYKPSQSDMESLIEIWNMQNKASFLEQIIYDDSDNLSLHEDLAWSKSGRLFSCGLNTYLNEYDLDNNRIKQSYCVNSSPAWCLSIDSSDKLIAVGTEDGFICVYKLHDDFLQYDKIMDKHDKRLLCIEWFNSSDNSSSPLLIGGTIDYIKIWNYQSGRCVDFIKVGNTGVVVWCVKVLSDFTIVSGDSNGTTSFWNGKMTTLNTSYKSHKGDILTICASNDEQTIYSSGVDPTIVQFSKNLDKSDCWVYALTRRPHSHDVRSLAFTKSNWLLSGGVDSLFSQTLGRPNLHVNHLLNVSSKLSVVSTLTANYACLQYSKFIQIWKLGSAQTDSYVECESANSVTITPLKIVDNAVKLLQINSRKAINCFAFNSEWLVYANYNNIKVILWSEDRIDKIKLLHDPIANISQICMLDGARIVVCHAKTFEVLKLDKFGVLSEHAQTLSDRICKVVATESKLIVSLADKTIVILDSTNFNLLTSFSNPLLPLELKINCFGTDRLWIAYANAMLVEYDLKSFTVLKSYSLTKIKSNENHESKSFNEHWPIKQIAFANNLVLFSDDNSLYSLNLQRNRITKCEKYRHIVYMDNLSINELAIVEVTPEMIFNMLPPTTMVKSFGT